MSIPYDHSLAEAAGFPVAQEGETDPVWPTYEKFVCNLVKQRNSTVANLEHMVIGICGEAGELADGIKRHTIYGKPLDRANIIEELGDLEFYIAGLRQMLGVSRYATLAKNVEKLAIRYKEGYSDAAAIERADKVEPPLHVIDMSAGRSIAAVAPVTLNADQVAAVDETAELAPALEEWVKPLLAAYQAGKIVQAISYTANTATVLFVGDPQPYKFYRPRGEV